MLGKTKQYIFPAVLILFIIEVLMLPLVLGMTFASKSKSPEHILTFEDFSLKWDKNTEVDQQGVASLSLFDTIYNNAESEDGTDILAPGTTGDSTIRLSNASDTIISYTAVAYYKKSADELPVSVDFTGDNLTDTTEYTLPENAKGANVIRAVKGNVAAGSFQSFNIDWSWLYDESSEQDFADTVLGDKAADNKADDISVGIYVVVEASGNTIVPTPETGDSFMAGYFVLLCLSGAILIVLLFMRRKETDKDEEGNK
ncbi:MAG: hypothetical protein ACI39R_05145 [Lachnospiraceae bacterium]